MIRNSITFVHRLSIDSKIKQNQRTHQLIQASTSHYLLSNSETKQVLTEVLSKYQNEGDLLHLHAQNVLKNKGELDSLVAKIMDMDVEPKLNAVMKAYMKIYAKSETDAQMYRRLLLTSCILLLALTIYGFIALLKAARNLGDANLNLEKRVIDRTAELSESKDMIVQQQQALMATAKLSALGEMAGGVAHEINTPLSIIGMRVEQMEECIDEGDINSSDFREAIDVIKVTVDRIAKIVSGLKFFSREGKAMPTTYASISAIIDETLALCRERFANHGVQLQVKNHTADLDLKLLCRPVEISQVILNLLINSFDAIQSLENRWINIDMKNKNGFLEINVTDSGAGIRAEIRDKIMQPFFTTKPIGKGTGLGLSISQGILTSHQGVLFLDTKSANTKFTILLPRTENSKPMVAS